MSLGSLRRRVQQAIDFKEEASKLFARTVRFQLTRAQQDAAAGYNQLADEVKRKAKEQLPALEDADAWGAWINEAREVIERDPHAVPGQFFEPPAEDSGLWDALQEHARGGGGPVRMAASACLWWLALARIIRQQVAT